MRSNCLLTILCLCVGACASTSQDGPVGPKTAGRLVVVQVPASAAGVWEACRDCPELTEKRVVVPLPPPPTVKKPSPALRSDTAAQPNVIESASPVQPPVARQSKRYTVHFAYASARLDWRARRDLEGAVATLGASSAGAEILGRTDPRGSIRFNQELAVKRAASVRNYLSSRGVSVSRLSVRAYDPCCDGPSDASEREMWDRRRSDVEIVIEPGSSMATASEQTHARQQGRGK